MSYFLFDKSGLARGANDAVCQANHIDPIASKPAPTHKGRLPATNQGKR